MQRRKMQILLYRENFVNIVARISFRYPTGVDLSMNHAAYADASSIPKPPFCTRASGDATTPPGNSKSIEMWVMNLKTVRRR